MLETIFKKKLTYFILFFYACLVIWWFKILFSGVKASDENNLFGLVYSFIPLIGGINGIFISRKWGGFKSLMGRAIIFMSAGLISYWFGQTAWSYYNFILKIDVPYPSVADIGYFSVIIFYTAGMYSLAKLAGAKVVLNKTKGKLLALLVPLSMLSISYYLFLQHITPDLSSPIKTFLDFGTPTGYAIVISTAFLAHFLTKGILGGNMKNRILFIIFALIIENITDNTFLYQAAAGTYYNAGVNDLMFATSFTIMSIGLISLDIYE